MPGEVLKISKRYSQPNLSYWRKTNRGPFGPPSSGRGLSICLIAIRCSCVERGLWWRWRHAPCLAGSPATHRSGMESDGRVGLDDREQQISHLNFRMPLAASWPRRPFTHPLPLGDDRLGSAVWCAERRAPVWSSGHTGWNPRRGMLTLSDPEQTTWTGSLMERETVLVVQCCYLGGLYYAPGLSLNAKIYGNGCRQRPFNPCDLIFFQINVIFP